MKRSLIAIAVFASALMAQPSKTATSGANTYTNARIEFGGNRYLTVTAGMDTLSDPITIESAGIRPGQMMAIEYFAIASDSTTSSYRLSVQSRVCISLPTGCPNKWLTPRFRGIYNTRHFADTVVVTTIPSSDTSSVSHSTMIPTGNQLRIRVRAISATSVYLRDLYLRGF